ncbi:MAG: tRNA (adenosine(37)-N6)-threonylcarbamoyltransferase complex ATPase subunit type 1 TsaE [Bacillota bacterium]
MAFSLESRSPEETFALGEMLGRLAGPGDVFCLNGDLGAGKTVFAKGLASGLGVGDSVVSPTFTIVNEYQGRVPFYHMDVYRLGSPSEMDDLGYEEYFYGQGVVLVEWAGRVGELLPEDRLDIHISVLGEGHRRIVFSPRGERCQCLVEELSRSVCTGD